MLYLIVLFAMLSAQAATIPRVGFGTVETNSTDAVSPVVYSRLDFVAAFSLNTPARSPLNPAISGWGFGICSDGVEQITIDTAPVFGWRLAYVMVGGQVRLPIDRGQIDGGLVYGLMTPVFSLQRSITVRGDQPLMFVINIDSIWWRWAENQRQF